MKTPKVPSPEVLEAALEATFFADIPGTGLAMADLTEFIHESSRLIQKSPRAMRVIKKFANTDRESNPLRDAGSSFNAGFLIGMLCGAGWTSEEDES